MSKKTEKIQASWENKISRAKAVRSAWKALFKVDKARDYLDGKQNEGGFSEEDFIVVNNVYSHLKAQLPALYAADPYFYVKLKKSYSPKPEDIALFEKRGKIRQSYLNYLKDEVELKQKVRLNIQDAFFSYGVIKTRFHADYEKNGSANEPMTGDDGEPLLDESGGPILEPEYVPVNERYVVERIHPDDFLWDEDAGPLPDSWNWLGHGVTITADDLISDRRFDKAAVRSLTKTGGDRMPKDDEAITREDRKKGGEVKGSAEFDDNYHQKETPPGERKIRYWEIYNLKKKTWLCVAEGADRLLMDEKKIPVGVETILRFTLRDDSPYPIPPMSQGLGVAKEYNLARSDIQKHRKRFNRKYELNVNGLIDEDEASKLENGEDGTIIRKMTSETLCTPIQDAMVDQTRYQELAYLKAEMIELFGGSSDEARGIAGADSATQAGILDKRLEMREGDSMSMVIDQVRDVARKLDMLVQVNITGEEAVKVTGPQGEFWELVREQDYEKINGEFEYGVNVGATIPQLPQMERSSFLAVLGILGNVPHFLTQPRLLKRILEMHHIDDEALLNDLLELGKQIMGGQMPQPGQTGSQPNVSESRPVSAAGGQAGGPKSLNLPGAGNFPG